MELDETPWKPFSIPVEIQKDYELRKCGQMSSAGAVERDAVFLIERLRKERGETFKYYCIKTTRQPEEGKLGGTVYWDLFGTDNLEEIRPESKNKNDTRTFFEVSDSGEIKEISPSS